MSELEKIEAVLRRTSQRRRWLNAWRGLWHGCLAAGILWLLVLLIDKVFPIPEMALLLAAVIGAVVVIAGFTLGWTRRATLLETARWVDAKQNLKERLSTALEVAESKKSNALNNSDLSPRQHWCELVVKDAAQSVSHFEPRALLPWHLPRASQWTLLVLILAAGLGFVPEYRSSAYLQKQRETAIIRETGRQLADLTRHSLEQRPPALEPTRKALDSVAELGDQLTRVQLTRSEALKELASAAEKIKEQARELGKNPAFKPLERSARNSNRGGSPGSPELQKQIEELQKSLGGQQADPKALEQFKRDLQKAKETAAGLPSKDAAAGEAARQQLAEALANLDKQAKDMGLSLPTIEEAMAALAASKVDQLLRDLQVAETDLEKLHEMAKALEQLQLKAEKMGKDLAEQLDNGQAEAAQATLEKMVQQLRSANLNSDQMNKIIDEVSRAISPASPYGKVADHLKQATGQCKAGQNSDAAQSLAAAAKELENLMQQMSDAKAMMASLESLQRAQMCIGNGQRWGQSKTPRAGQGQGVGAGVGTWADDNRWLDPSEIKDRWDNSGVVRPDQEARGLTDRGDGQLPDSLEPTKIKGRMNPGGPMPSITLKGVSIKGLSKVDFTEKATAAQSEAQSALSQEQVPRAYKSAVRDYFDDLKK